MTKGKKWTLRLLGVAALALLICLCLLGSTMARYTSSGNGSGTLTVAVWDLETTTVKIGTDDDAVKISPSDIPYYANVGDEKGQERKKDCGVVPALTMVNNSAVAAKVTLELATPDENDTASTALSSGLTLTEAKDFTWGTGYSGDEGTYGTEESPKGKAQTNKYGLELMSHFGTGAEGETAFLEVVNAYGVIALTLTSDEAGTTPISAEEPIYLNAKGDTSNDLTDSMTVYADVVWTSIYEGASVASGYLPSSYGFGTTDNEDWEDFSDAVDSILGMYYEGISFSVTWTAVQNSTQP